MFYLPGIHPMIALRLYSALYHLLPPLLTDCLSSVTIHRICVTNPLIRVHYITTVPYIAVDVSAGICGPTCVDERSVTIAVTFILESVL